MGETAIQGTVWALVR